jgi:hypothetical protein
MAQVGLLKAISNDAYTSLQEGVDAALADTIESTQGPRSLWADAAATSVTIGGGTPAAPGAGHNTILNAGVANGDNAGGDIVLNAGDTGGATSSAGNIVLLAGNATTAGGTHGSVLIDTGTGSGTILGTISVGAANTSLVIVGRTGISTNVLSGLLVGTAAFSPTATGEVRFSDNAGLPAGSRGDFHWSSSTAVNRRVSDDTVTTPALASTYIAHDTLPELAIQSPLQPTVTFKRHRGTLAAPTTVLFNETIGALLGESYIGPTSGFVRSGAVKIVAATTPPVDNVSAPTAILFETTAIGSLVKTPRWRFASNGDLLSETGQTVDVGEATQVNSPRNVYAATSVVVGATVTTTTNAISHSSNAAFILQKSGTGDLVVDAGGNTGNTLQLRGGSRPGGAALPGGNVSITGGLGGGAGGDGGAIGLTAGSGRGAANSGGDVVVSGGQSDNVGGSSPGNVRIVGGAAIGGSGSNGGNTLVDGGQGDTTDGQVLIGGAATTSAVVIGQSGITTDFPSGSTVDFTGATVTGLLGLLDITDRTNTSGGLLAQGTLVAPGATNKSFVAADPTTPTAAASRPWGVVMDPAGIADSATGTLRTISGTEAPVLLVTGLLGTVAVGDEIIVSTTTGRGTLSKVGGTAQPTSGMAINRCGIVVDLLTYDGAGDDLVLVQLDYSARRIA